jgi:transposase-like protein
LRPALEFWDVATEEATDRGWLLRVVVDELMAGAFHNTEQSANNRIEADHGRLRAAQHHTAVALFIGSFRGGE